MSEYLQLKKLLKYSEVARDACVSVDTARRNLGYLRGNEIRKIAEPSIWAIPSRRRFTR